METKLSWREARDLLLPYVTPVPVETVSLSAAAGRILAEEIRAKENVPPFDRSPFDGYAFRSADTQGELPVTLKILEEIPAGSVATCSVVPGTAVKILTGAPIPPGADAVTKYEETEFTAETVTLKRAYAYDENIAHAGEDVAEGEILASRGQRIDAGIAGTLASQHIAHVSVYRKPIVGIITTGSEVSDVEDEPAPGKIPNSNRYALEAAITYAGLKPKFYASPADNVDDISAAVAQAIEECDAVITTGGVSVGDYDLTPASYQKAGVDLICGDLRLKPGGKSCFGRKDGTLVLGLSGNPASSMTCYYAVVLPLLHKLRGDTADKLPEMKAALAVAFRKKNPNPRLLRGHLAIQDGRLYFVPADKQGNGSMQTLAGANAMAEIEAKATPLEAGAEVTVFYIGE